MCQGMQDALIARRTQRSAHTSEDQEPAAWIHLEPEGGPSEASNALQLSKMAMTATSSEFEFAAGR